MHRQWTSRDEPVQAPWLRNEKWSSGVVRDGSTENLIPLWVFTLAWNILTALALIPHTIEFIHGHDKSRFIALVFPAIGLTLLIWAGRRTRRIRKFGASILNLQTLPATPGGELAGTIHVTQSFQAKSAIQLQLVCIMRYMMGIGRNSRVVDRIVWSETQTIDRLPTSQDGMDIPVLFHIPADAHPSSDLALGDGVRWKLEARCKTGGVSYYSRFEVPVFVADPAEIAAARGLVASGDSTEASDPRSALRERGITYQRFANGRLRIYFAAARNKSSVIVTVFIGLILAAIAIALAAWPDFHMSRDVALSIASIVLFAGVVFGFIAIFNLFVTEEIIVRYGSLTVERLAPMYHQERTFKLGDIADVFHKGEGIALFSYSLPPERKMGSYSLMLKMRDGELIRLATDINQRDYAAWLAEEIRDTLGVVNGK